MTKRKRRWRGERRRKSPVVTLASQASSSLLIGDNIDFGDDIEWSGWLASLKPPWLDDENGF